MGGRPEPVTSLPQNEDETTLDTQPLHLSGGGGECCSGLQAGNTEGCPVWPGMAPGDLVWPTSANDSLESSWPASAQCVVGVQQGSFVLLGSGPLPGLGEATGCRNLMVSQELGLLFSPPALWCWMLHSEPPSGHKERPPGCGCSPCQPSSSHLRHIGVRRKLRAHLLQPYVTSLTGQEEPGPWNMASDLLPRSAIPPDPCFLEERGKM